MYCKVGTSIKAPQTLSLCSKQAQREQIQDSAPALLSRTKTKPQQSLSIFSAFIPVLFGVWNLNVKNPHFFPVLIELVLLCLTNTPVFMDLMNIKVFRVVFIY